MADKQDGLRKHIKSAKGWLGRAESSLDNNNEVRGDLSIMLAQAELQHAQEVKHKSLWLIWLKRLTPVLIALLVGIGYMALLRPAEPQVVYVKPEAVASGSVAAEAGSGTQGTAGAEAGAGSEAGAGGLEKAADTPSSSDSLAGHQGLSSSEQPEKGRLTSNEPVPESMDSRYNNLGAPENSDSAVNGRAENSAELQKLMQSAGKILRE